MGGAPVEAFAVVAKEDGPAGAFADGQVDGAGGAGNEGDDRWLVPFSDDAECAVSAFEAHLLDVS